MCRFSKIQKTQQWKQTRRIEVPHSREKIYEQSYSFKLRHISTYHRSSHKYHSFRSIQSSRPSLSLLFLFFCYAIYLQWPLFWRFSLASYLVNTVKNNQELLCTVVFISVPLTWMSTSSSFSHHYHHRRCRFCHRFLPSVTPLLRKISCLE